VTGVFYLLVVCAETFGAGRHDILSLTQQHNPLEYLTSRYWSPSALFVIDLVVVLTGLGFVTAAVNAIIRILFAMDAKGSSRSRFPAFPAAIPRSWRLAVSPRSRLCSGCR
jgi:hypothetical protein